MSTTTETFAFDHRGSGDVVHPAPTRTDESPPRRAIRAAVRAIGAVAVAIAAIAVTLFAILFGFAVAVGALLG
jgi:hypothetical protein